MKFFAHKSSIALFAALAISCDSNKKPASLSIEIISIIDEARISNDNEVRVYGTDEHVAQIRDAISRLCSLEPHSRRVIGSLDVIIEARKTGTFVGSNRAMDDLWAKNFI